MKAAFTAVLGLALCAAAVRAPLRVVPHATIAAPALPYVAGSLIPLTVDPAFDAVYSLLGPGVIDAGFVRTDATRSSDITVVAASSRAVAMQTFSLVPPPRSQTPFIAVASYDAGIVLHRMRAPFTATSLLGVGGPPSDVAIANGSLFAGSTDGDALFAATLEPWTTRTVAGVHLIDELAVDASTGSVYATDRDISGLGAITRIARDGAVTTRLLGQTAEGIAIDARRNRVYVANVNDGTISIVDASTLVELQRFKAVDRVFALALSADGTRLFATSNQSTTSPFAKAGCVVAFDLHDNVPKRIATSRALAFPLGIAYDSSHGHLFVTDESANTVYELNDRLRMLASISTCETPWKPYLDGTRLYVPCARADRVDVIDTLTLAHAPGAPFATGGYPLAVAVYHP